jgi:phosphoketolase
MSIAGEDAVTERRKAHVIEEQDLHRVDAYWRAANYLYVHDNAL